MAYGPNNGTVPFTGFTPTLGINGAVQPQTSGAVQRNGMTNDDYDIAHAMATRAARPTRELLLTLLGVVAGSTAADTYKRRQGIVRGSALDHYEGGGVVNVEQVTLVNRATVAGDVTNITALLTREPKPSAYAVDASGNGGGGKAGY